MDYLDVALLGKVWTVVTLLQPLSKGREGMACLKLPCELYKGKVYCEYIKVKESLQKVC